MTNRDNSKSRVSSLLFELIENKADDETLNLAYINSFFVKRGLGVLLILFSFPMAIPLPYPPGFTTILGVPLLFYSIQMIFASKTPWLPNWLAKKEIKISHLKLAINKTSKFFAFIESFSKPRLLSLTSIDGERLIGFLAFLCSISIALPIMFGNAIPSLGVFIMSLGLLNRDGVLVILGIITSIIGLFIASAVVFLGVALVKKMLVKILPFLNSV